MSRSAIACTRVPHDHAPIQRLEYASPETTRKSRAARVSEILTWLLAWLLAFLVLGALCVGPMICDPPEFIRNPD